MAVLPEFNHDQILFLQTIFNFFHAKGKWPTYDDVDRIITQKHPNFNMEAVSKSLPDGFAAGFGFQRQYDQEAFFIVPALHYCQGAEEEIADFIRVVRLCVERYDRYYSFGEDTPEKDALEFSSELLSSQLHMEPLAIRKMGLLLKWEFDIAFGFSSGDIEYNSWHFPLKRGDGVSRFRGVETFEQYIEKRSPLVLPYSTGRFPLGLAQGNSVSNMTIVGLRKSSTQVHVHGEQNMKLSGNGATVWDNLVAELQRINTVAIKIQNYENGLPKLGISMDEYDQFLNDYLDWYSDCLAVLPDDMKEKFCSDYENKAQFFIKKAHFTAPISDEYEGKMFLYSHEKWFYDAYVSHKLMLLEASKRKSNSISTNALDAIAIIEKLAQGFHAAVLQLRKRHDNRPSFVEIKDEYDVQDLFHAMLIPFFNDIRREDPTPSVAGSPSRIDFLLKQEQIAIEIKKTREGLKSKQLGEELIVDMKRYRSHVDFKTFIAFVYDPDRHIRNPKEIENDLSGLNEGANVKVFIVQS